MEKYGFVYIWYDRKHKRYYIGCHWGNINDGYICSSTWMKQGYKNRPNDFKRRILNIVNTNKKDLLEEEYRWLSKIKKEELGKKYYNKHNRHFDHWSTDEVRKAAAIQKMKRSFSDEHKRKISQSKSKSNWKPSEDHKRKNSEKLTGRNQPKELIEKRIQSRKNGKGWVVTDEQKKKISMTQKGRKLSEETKRKISETMKMRHKEEGQ